MTIIVQTAAPSGTTILTVVNSILGRLGLSTVSAAISSSDPQITNILALINEEGQELSNRYTWTELQREATYTTVATEYQCAIEQIAPGWNYTINDTIWNRTLRRPVFGPQPPAVWQQQKAFAINGPWSNYRVRAGNLYMYPTPVADQTCYFEYISKNWLVDTTGVTSKEIATADTDQCLLDWHLIVLGAIWRWKKLKGFEYAEDFNSYERRVMDAMARDGGKDSLSLTNTKYDIMPGVVVPAGSWAL